MVPLFAKLIFMALMIVLAVYSTLLIFVLIRFAKSKILGLVLSTVYFILIASFFGAAVVKFQSIPF